ncbi:MAG: HAMP domain-containing sensor histidine kinase, partial [Bacteroidota bacterium]
RDKHVAWIKSAVQNLTGILDDFLSLSKLEEGKITVKMEAFDWSDFLKGIIEELQGILKNGQFIKASGHEVVQMIHTDRRLLKNVLFNLLSNAIKYSPAQAPIYCQSEIRGEELWIRIEDKGMGIPKADQEHLFTRFFRATNVTNIQGTGLGLNIVKKYIELLMGEISFESEEGVGTSFEISIPINH